MKTQTARQRRASVASGATEVSVGAGRLGDLWAEVRFPSWESERSYFRKTGRRPCGEMGIYGLKKRKKPCSLIHCFHCRCHCWMASRDCKEVCDRTDQQKRGGCGRMKTCNHYRGTLRGTTVGDRIRRGRNQELRCRQKVLRQRGKRKARLRCNSTLNDLSRESCDKSRCRRVNEEKEALLRSRTSQRAIALEKG